MKVWVVCNRMPGYMTSGEWVIVGVMAKKELANEVVASHRGVTREWKIVECEVEGLGDGLIVFDIHCGG